MHPIALAAVIVLVFNDWVAKPRWHGVVTGKVSDLAGLAFAPVLLSAMIGLCRHGLARIGVPIDPSLTRFRLIACCAATAAGFALVKLCPPVADVIARAIGHHAEFYPDWTDLLCLPAVLVAFAIGRDELRRVPLGRPAAIHRLGRAAAPALRDVVWAGGNVHVLAPAVDAWDVARIDTLLRDGPPG